MFFKKTTGYSLQASLEERARKKAPTLDIVVSKKILVPTARNFEISAFSKRLDGIKKTEQVSPKILSRKQFLIIKLLQMRRLVGQYARYSKKLFQNVLPHFTPHKMLYGSLVGGIAFGMVSMAFIEHFFGEGVFARSQTPLEVVSVPREVVTALPVLQDYDPQQDIFFEYFGQVTKEKYEDSIRDMVKGYPIEEMLPFIFAQDRLTAAFLIGIAKKESNWGKRVPVLEGQDCFNYWGYRGVRRMMGTGGHTCFNSRKDAVETVTKRLETLIHSEKLDTPEKMIVWKCGFSCEGHSRESVKKWIADVDMYFSQLSEE